MNIEELRAQLEQLAGPEPSPTAGAREAVHRRARRQRLRMGAMTATATVLVVAIVVAGVHAAQESPVSVRTLTSTTASAPAGLECTVIPPTVPAAEVPSDVSKWADDKPVIGERELWTIRSAPAVRANRQPDGSWLLKFPWFTRPFGIPTFAGGRLDGPGTFHGNGDQAIDQSGVWVASSLEFSAAGCWEVTARYQTAAITFRILVGEPPKPSGQSATGTISGTLRDVGGTVPTASQAVAGTIHVDGLSESWSGTTASDGSFATQVPAGTYTVTGVQGNGGGMTCSAGGPVVVNPGKTTKADVVCALP
jgi:hypothetical protein